MREATVVDAFSEWLRLDGWDVSTEVDWADVVARRDSHRLVVEAKGSTAATGLDVDTAYGQLLRRMSTEPDTTYAIVVPESAVVATRRVPDHVLALLRITVFAVGDGRTVRQVAGPDLPGRR